MISFGPVSVLPTFQNQGIGSTLIRHSIKVAKESDYPAICIYGDPRYYSRFGFRCAEKYEIKTSDNKYAVALQALELKPRALTGIRGRFVESNDYQCDPKQFEEYEATFPYKVRSERVLASLRY